METPELDKRRRAIDEGHSFVIGEFLDWLQSQEGVHLMVWNDYFHDWFHDGRKIEELLADYFDIDLKGVERELTALLELQREANA